MNFLSKVIFGNKGNQQPSQQDIEFQQYSSFTAEASFLEMCGNKKEMIFEDCNVTFVRDEQQDYKYYIKVDDKNKTDDEQNQEDQYYLVIEPNMVIQKFINKFKKQNIVGFQWKFEDSYLQLLFDSNDNIDGDLFQQLMCNLIYQTTNRKTIDDDIDQTDLQQYCQDMNFTAQTKKKENIQKVGQPTIVEQSTIVRNNNQVINRNYEGHDQDHYDRHYNQNYMKIQELMTEMIQQNNVKVAYTGQLYNITDRKTLVNTNIVYMIVQKDKFLYSQKIVDVGSKKVSEILINPNFNFNIDYLENAVKFIDSQKSEGLMVVFDKEVISDVKTQILQCRYEEQEQNNLESILKKFGEDQMQVKRQLDSDQIMQIEQISEIRELDQQDYDDFEINNLSVIEPQQQQQIKQILYAQNHNRTFANNDNVIQVYDNQNDQFQEICELPRLKVDGQNIDSKDMMLFSDNQKFLITDSQQNQRFYEYDINRQQLTGQIQADQGIKINQLMYSQKNQNQTNNQVLYGINNQNIYQLDLRLDNKKTLGNVKSYKTNPKFNSICPSMNGKFAVGSDDGVIRLYRELGKNSLNNFYTLSRNKITMIDCTKDGKYMVVTTDKELFLFDCSFENKNGFENRLQSAKGERQPAICLKLSIDDIQKYRIDGNSIKFQKARFDESAQNEKYIVASMNQYIVTWSIRNILNGQPYKYKMYKAQNNQTIVDNRFKYGDQETQMFATRNSLCMKRLNQIRQRVHNR